MPLPLPRAALGLMLLACPAPGPAGADQVTIIAPVWSRIVAWPLPAGFVSGHEEVSGESYLHEFIPEGESVQAWSEMITLTGGQGLAAQLGEGAVAAMADQLLQGYQGACPDSFSAFALDPPQVPGAEAVFAGQLGCGSLAGQDHGEAMVFVIASGGGDLFTLQWALRAPPGPGQTGYDAALWDPMLGFLAAGLRLCPPVAGEEPPYPSCGG